MLRKQIKTQIKTHVQNGVFVGRQFLWEVSSGFSQVFHYAEGDSLMPDEYINVFLS